MTLFGCMSVWNEAPLIGPAIDSLFAVGCERVIVVDGQWAGFAPGEPDASTDGTQDIARQHGAEVIGPPVGGWASQVEARNAYLLGKRGDWYLVCDADERCHGTLPPLNDDANTYWVELKGPVSSGPISGTRLFRHGETIQYYGRHYTIYVDGVLLAKPTLTAYAFCIEGVERNDPGRVALKAAFYPVQKRTEFGGDLHNPRPILKRIPPVHLGPVRYIGNGAWIAGIPASDMEAWQVDQHYEGIAANLLSANPIYELVNLPAATPDKPKTRRKSRKE